MPESYGTSRRGVVWTLSKANEVGQIVRIRCTLCRIRRYYRPADLKEVVGDVGIDGVTRRMRCEKCGKNDYLDALLFFPTAEEWTKIRIRRLVEIRMVRNVIWRDESP